MINLSNLGVVTVQDFRYLDFTFMPMTNRNGDYYQIYNRVEDYGLAKTGTSIEDCKSIVDAYLAKN